MGRSTGLMGMLERLMLSCIIYVDILHFGAYLGSEYHPDLCS